MAKLQQQNEQTWDEFILDFIYIFSLHFFSLSLFLTFIDDKFVI